MQKIILTSTGFNNKVIENKFLELINIQANKIKAIFIPTAAITEVQKVFVPICKMDLLNAGVLEENIMNYDLDRIMESEEICKYDAIYVCGGDTQYLLHKMNEVKFYTPLKSFINNSGVYVGVSAGSIVMAKNLQNNLGYINCILNVHMKDGTELGHIEIDYCPTINLTDNQAAVIANEDTYIIE